MNADHTVTSFGVTDVQSPISRVVIISDDSVESGGAAAVALQSARLLSRRGVHVTFFTGDAGLNSPLKNENVEIIALGGRNLLEQSRAGAMLRGLYDNHARLTLQRWIDANDTPETVYHLHNWHKILSPAIFSAISGVQGRLFLTAHDYFLTCPNGGYTNFQSGNPCTLRPLGGACISTNCDKRNYGHKLWRMARHMVRAHLYNVGNTDATIVAVSNAMVALLERGGIPRRSIQILRNPVTPWRTCRVPAEINKQIFYVGRLELDKGANVVAEAAALAKAPLTVVGDGPLKSTISALHPTARLTGRLNRQELGELIGEARLLVMPTRWPETFGLVAAEAAMSGVPVIASHLAPVSVDIVLHGFGLSCDPGDVTQLARQLTALMADDTAIAAMSQAAFAGARLLAPTSDQWCDQLIELYERKLRSTGRRRSSPSEPRVATAS